MTRTYRANLDGMQTATDSLSTATLTLQGDAGYDGVKGFMQKYGSIRLELKSGHDRLAVAGILMP